jgi:hypothetical protein
MLIGALYKKVSDFPLPSREATINGKIFLAYFCARLNAFGVFGDDFLQNHSKIAVISVNA